jgi:hypothetical protein
MFGLFRLLISLAMFAAFIWFATTVPLGKHTLWGHLSAIFRTQAAQDLADGTKEEAEKVAKRVKDELHHPPDLGGAAARHVKEPLPPVETRERAPHGDKLVKSKPH